MTTRTTSDIDLFSDEAIHEPYGVYRDLRDLGPVVWMERHQVWCLSRYEEVRDALAEWETYSSAEGVALNDPTNQTLRGTTIASDPPLHDQLRGIVGERLTPRAVRSMRDAVEAQADELVERLVAQESFDVVADLARALPLAIVPDLLGLPQQIRPRLLDWAAAGFDTMGPLTPRVEPALDKRLELFAYTSELARSGDLAPGTLGADILAAAERGEIRDDECPALFLDYLVPALDTTISSISTSVWLFGRHPDQWDLVRADPTLIPKAFNEALRLESPVRGFSRVSTRDVDFDGTTVRAGDRVLLLFASANRDERRWPEPERFDVTRDAAGHVAFGYGVHGCAGQGLARLEGHAVLGALARRVARFDIGEPRHITNSMIRALSELPVTVRAA